MLMWILKEIIKLCFVDSSILSKRVAYRRVGGLIMDSSQTEALYRTCKWSSRLEKWHICIPFIIFCIIFYITFCLEYDFYRAISYNLSSWLDYDRASDFETRDSWSYLHVSYQQSIAPSLTPRTKSEVQWRQIRKCFYTSFCHAHD